VRVHLAREHALEFERLDLFPQAGGVRDHRFRGVVVAFGNRKLEQLGRTGEPGRQLREAFDDLAELRALATERLRTRRVVPDVGMFELARYFFEPLTLGIEVKDTP
jgi:hypothetical protein